ncbi:hypothetical protein AFK69_10160 [Xenorhabdus sp. GDc328]|uniref:hypothetical protein n=1 Tax=Xenorhabdus TaxID=626 RepID=UPI000649ED56|nr:MULTISPECIES: hypothetical protein [Xenorhabdus]KLU14534.1 hypothetical protein AAY47_15880 [Xenorhabdus griffiniae]KOP33325.1 hypothetical protein AFK69_10160 [Xenorhabdus sp. GDc328]
MSIIATKEVSKTINVPFYGSDLYVVNYNGEPYVPMMDSTVIDIINIALYTCLRGLETLPKPDLTNPVSVGFFVPNFDNSLKAITPPIKVGRATNTTPEKGISPRLFGPFRASRHHTDCGNSKKPNEVIHD